MISCLRLIALGICSAGCVLNPPRINVLYTLDFAAVDDGFLLVRASFSGHSPSELVGRARMRLSDVEVSSPHEAVVVLKPQSVGEISVVAMPTLAEGSTVSYRVRPGEVWEKESRGEDLGVRFGFLSRSFSVLDGSGLFLLPRDEAELGEVTVRIENLPSSVQLFTTLRKQSGVFVPDPLSGGSAAARLHQSLLALGTFKRQTVDIGEARLDILTEARLDRIVGQSQRDSIASAFERISSEVGPGLKDLSSYSILLFPHAPSGHAIHVSSSRRAQGLSVGSWTPFLRQRLHYNLVNAFIRDQPGGLAYAPESLWLAEGFAQYISLLTTTEAPDFAFRMKQAYDRYFIDPRITFSNLSSPPPAVGLQPPRHSPKALLLTYWIDQKLSARGLGIFDLIQAFQRRGNRVDLKPLLSGLTDPATAAEVLDFVAKKDRIISPDILPQPPEKLSLPVEDQNRPERIANGAGGLVHSAFRVAYMAKTYGFLENCGCKGNDWGGVARRQSALRHLRASSDHFLALDAGDFFPLERRAPFLNPQTLRELSASLTAMSWMRLDAVGIGLNELRYSLRSLRSQVDGLDLPLVSSNVLDEQGDPIAAPYVQRRFGPYRALIVGAWSYREPNRYVGYFQDSFHGLRVEDPAAAVAKVLESTDAEREDIVIVLGNVGPQSAQRIVDRVPEVDLIITGHRHRIDYEEIPLQADDDLTFRLYREHFPTKYKQTLILFAVSDGYAVAFADLEIQGGMIKKGRVHTLPLSDKIEDDEKIAGLITDFYRSESVGETVYSPQPTPAASSPGAHLVGAQSCRACHAGQFDQWTLSRHATAYKRLITRRRHRVARCVACHVTGYGADPGFRDARDEKVFGGVQCEMCHGPGSDHIQSPLDHQLRALPSAGVCRGCHTPEHSQRFDYESRIGAVAHSQPSPLEAVPGTRRNE